MPFIHRACMSLPSTWLMGRSAERRQVVGCARPTLGRQLGLDCTWMKWQDNDIQWQVGLIQHSIEVIVNQLAAKGGPCTPDHVRCSGDLPISPVGGT